MKGKVSAARGRAPIASPEDDLLLDCTDIKSKKQDNSEYDSLTYNHNNSAGYSWKEQNLYPCLYISKGSSPHMMCHSLKHHCVSSYFYGNRE
jgi:hypothetical protein